MEELNASERRVVPTTKSLRFRGKKQEIQPYKENGWNETRRKRKRNERACRIV